MIIKTDSIAFAPHFAAMTPINKQVLYEHNIDQIYFTRADKPEIIVTNVSQIIIK